jgi:uncharacterized cofD-like protein
MRQLFEYRFERGQGLKGHSFGNLLLTALDNITGGMDHAITEAARLLRIKGAVLPVTLEHSHLFAELDGGKIVEGETAIDLRRDSEPIKRVYLNPPAQATDAAQDAILAADMVVIGPGDLYTSILPNLLVEGIGDAIARSAAIAVYVCNVMTKHGETDNYAASDFLRVITDHLGRGELDAALLSYYESIPPDVLARYEESHSTPVSIDQRCYQYAPRLVVRPLTAAGSFVRHDPDRLADALMSVLEVATAPARSTETAGVSV